MRAPLVFEMTGASAATAAMTVRTVKSDRFRDFWFRSKWNGSQFTIDCYRTKAEAEAETSKLASGTHAAGAPNGVVLNVAGGAPFDPTPMTLDLTTNGTWNSAIIGYVAAPERHLIERMLAVLSAYRAANESLESLKTLTSGHALPQSSFPAAVVLPGPFAEVGEWTGAPHFADKLLIEIRGYDDRTDDDAGVASVSELMGTLRSICLDEQRRWGGMALDTKAKQAVEYCVRQDEGGFLLEGRLLLEVHIGDVLANYGATGVPFDGGKYIAGL